MNRTSVAIALAAALVLYAGFTATFNHPSTASKPNPYGLTQWQLDHQDNPEVQSWIEITKARQR